MACLAARCGKSERARKALRQFVEAFISPNGFHLNGDFKRTGLSWWTYRPFTLEGNFAFLEAIHEMLVQSWGGKLRIFPSVPPDWQNVVFSTIRVEGGFLVSATRKIGKVESLQITALSDHCLKLVDPFKGGGTWSMECEDVDGECLRWELKKGDQLYGEQ